jgi:tripartite-type tricarboxylate transporter receptor subunit TctC
MDCKYWLAAAAAALALLVLKPQAGLSQDPFYKGKTVRIIVGFSAGGGFDTYSRILARHLGKHIPGNPTVVVENMTGAASMIAANHLYNVAKPDGLTIGNWNGGLILNQIFQRPGVNFDASKFEWIGAPVGITSICTFSAESGITSIDKWIASPKPIKVGATGLGSDLYDFPKILQTALNLPTQFISGYKGFADIKLALESGEVAGVCPSWEITKATWKKSIESRDVAIVLQALPKAHADLPNVPLAINHAKSEESRQLIQTGIHDVSIINRPYSLPPGTPKERVLLLRQAFQDTLNDRELTAEAVKSHLDFDPKTGEMIEKTVSRVLNLSPAAAKKLKEILN